MARKLALIIGNSQYEDAGLARLAAPDVDVRALGEILQTPGIGAFDEVIPLLNEGLATVRKAIARFFDAKHRDDLLLLYFSGTVSVMSRATSISPCATPSERCSRAPQLKPPM